MDYNIIDYLDKFGVEIDNDKDVSFYKNYIENYVDDSIEEIKTIILDNSISDTKYFNIIKGYICDFFNLQNVEFKLKLIKVDRNTEYYRLTEKIWPTLFPPSDKVRSDGRLNKLNESVLYVSSTKNGVVENEVPYEKKEKIIFNCEKYLLAPFCFFDSNILIEKIKLLTDMYFLELLFFLGYKNVDEKRRVYLVTNYLIDLIKKRHPEADGFLYHSTKSYKANSLKLDISEANNKAPNLTYTNIVFFYPINENYVQRCEITNESNEKIKGKFL